MDISNFIVDHEAEEEGTWEPIGVGDLEVKMRSPYSKSYKKARKAAERPYMSDIRKGKVSDEVQRKIMLESIYNGALVDWRHFEENGEPIRFDQVNVRRIISEDYRPILQGTLEAFIRLANDERDEAEDEEKKSGKLRNMNSDGDSTGMQFNRLSA